MADPTRRHGFLGLAAADPGGPLAAFAAQPAGQAALRGRLEDRAFAAAAEAALEAPLPAAGNRAGGEGPVTTMRLGPDYWLAIHETDPDWAGRLEATVGLGALDLSSARSRLRLRGAAARDLLAVGAAIDLRPDRFPAGAFAQTTVGNATAILHARERDVFDVYVARSFAQSWALWLAHAGEEFQLELSKE